MAIRGVVTLLPYQIWDRACFCPGIFIQTSVQVDPVTGLSTASSTLQYAAEKDDTDAQFSCSTQHYVGAELVSSPVTFTVTCESKNNADRAQGYLSGRTVKTFKDGRKFYFWTVLTEICNFDSFLPPGQVNWKSEACETSKRTDLDFVTGARRITALGVIL